LALTETIVPENSSTAWAVFDVRATGSLPLAGNPSAHWNITISGIQTQPATLIRFFAGFDVNGTPDPYPFPGTTIGPNPITGTGSVANGTVDPSNFSFMTSQQLFADLPPFNLPPNHFGDTPANTPTGFTIGGEYQLQAVPEPTGITLCVLAGTAGLFRAWRRRSV
jgi:hypothetical protein